MKKLLLKCGMNLAIALIFVLLHTWALMQGFEETHVFLAILYGIVIMITNVSFFWFYAKH